MNEIINTFIAVARLAGVTINDDQIRIEDRECPHDSPDLPDRHMAVYVFIHDKVYLRIGKVGSRSHSRFKNHHYNPNSSGSNLAKSILGDNDMKKFGLDENNVGDWIRRNTQRIDILIDSSISIFALELLESFLHCKLNPKYEGFQSQRE